MQIFKYIWLFSTVYFFVNSLWLGIGAHSWLLHFQLWNHTLSSHHWLSCWGYQRCSTSISCCQCHSFCVQWNVIPWVFSNNKFGSLIVIVHFPQAQLVPVEGGNNTQSVSAAVANMYPFYTTTAVSSQPTSWQLRSKLQISIHMLGCEYELHNVMCYLGIFCLLHTNMNFSVSVWLHSKSTTRSDVIATIVNQNSFRLFVFCRTVSSRIHIYGDELNELHFCAS